MKQIFFLFFLLLSVFTYGQRTILWKITNNNTRNVSYLLGTNHLFGESFIDSFPVIKEKLQASELIITELNLDRIKIAEYYNARPASDTFFSVLSKEDAAFVTDIVKKRRGLTDISKFTPGEIFLKLQAYYPKFKCSVLNQNDTLAMDEYLQNLCTQLHKKAYYFETDSFQAKALAETSKIIDWKLFKKNVPSLLNKYRSEKPDETPCSLVNQYASFAIEYKFEEDCDLIKNKNANDILIKKRNEDWIQKLSVLLQQNNCFIAVGLGHLLNKCGLIQQIKELGYVTEPVMMK